jgi:hypothetical protein
MKFKVLSEQKYMFQLTPILINNKITQEIRKRLFKLMKVHLKIF